MEAGGGRRRRSPMEIAILYTAATAGAEAGVATTRNWFFYFYMRTVVILGGLCALFIGCLMMIYFQTWLDSLFLLPLLLVSAIMFVYASATIQDARYMERERVVRAVRKTLESEGL